MKVLLVEDNDRLRAEVARTLQGIPGTEVVKAATTSAQAREWLAQHPEEWDLALVDLFLREGHGFEVLRSCRRPRPQQKAVVLTNYTREPVRQYARKAGADAFFDKSMDMDALVEFCIRHSESCRSR